MITLSIARGEATLTKDLTGFGKSMDKLFDEMPLLKPFYLFARTGINGLQFSMKHVPGLNMLVKEYNDIILANPENLEAVAKPSHVLSWRYVFYTRSCDTKYIGHAWIHTVCITGIKDHEIDTPVIAR